ncbi:MAG: hypothetical protein ONB48_11710 [candidate division KSB1 bacterium]|nr:hypothetical protein [candidate division KSB1 bacterium]MDZ7275378.1 hypothetical protein [candidate division KSB1 bacterium]MDZ7286309.1 hypothetical protein [candidate division KSB1 bacterium]MDZ7296536.1 hypothetical protein [candidate division KSB1 bacterium]MDZ7309145.1 hypothetical protein [candidate division KSB1 bacterium]
MTCSEKLREEGTVCRQGNLACLSTSLAVAGGLSHNLARFFEEGRQATPGRVWENATSRFTQNSPLLPELTARLLGKIFYAPTLAGLGVAIKAALLAEGINPGAKLSLE